MYPPTFRWVLWVGLLGLFVSSRSAVLAGPTRFLWTPPDFVVVVPPPGTSSGVLTGRSIPNEVAQAQFPFDQPPSFDSTGFLSHLMQRPNAAPPGGRELASFDGEDAAVAAAVAAVPLPSAVYPAAATIAVLAVALSIGKHRRRRHV
jgi:hypothetical protein